MGKTMLAAVLHGIKDLRVEQRPLPEVAPGHVLLRIRRAGICGTDVHYFEEGRAGNFAMSAPFTLGHEIMGEVVSLGPGVKHPMLGQRVVVNPAHQCGQCHYCRSGRGNLCRSIVMLGSASTTPPTHGAFSEFLLISTEQCYAITDKLDDAIAALMEPFAVALHALHRAGSVSGKAVLVTGGGPIGLLTLIAARAYGAVTVVLSDPLLERRQMAVSVGADHALDPTLNTFAADASSLTPDGFDVLFEASGAPAALKHGLGTVRKGGTVVQIGVFSVPEVALPLNQMLVREIQFHGSFRYGDVWEEAIALATSGRVNLAPLVSRVFPLEQAVSAMELACARTGVVKVQLDFLQTPPQT